MNKEKLQNIDWDKLTFSITPARSMYIAHCELGGEWEEGKLIPYGDISLSPAAGVLNYGQGIFEGMKAYRSAKDRVVLFRPEKNAIRASSSAERVVIPKVPKKMFVDAVENYGFIGVKIYPAMGFYPDCTHPKNDPVINETRFEFTNAYLGFAYRPYDYPEINILGNYVYLTDFYQNF